MHPVPTVLPGRPQDGPECWVGQQCMRWEANPSCLLPLLELFFGNIAMSFFHPVPALENFLVRNQMQLVKFAMLCNLWHGAIFCIIVIVISKLENVGTLLTKAATTVSFGAPRKFGSLTIHNKKTQLQEESFAKCCMPWWLLQLQTQFLHISIAAVKYRFQQCRQNLAQVAIQGSNSVTSDQPNCHPCSFLLQMDRELFYRYVYAPHLPGWHIGQDISWCHLICIDQQGKWAIVFCQSFLQQGVESTSCPVSCMDVWKQIHKLYLLDATIHTMQPVFQQQWAIAIHLFHSNPASFPHILCSSELR